MGKSHFNEKPVDAVDFFHVMNSFTVSLLGIWLTFPQTPSTFLVSPLREERVRAGSIRSLEHFVTEESIIGVFFFNHLLRVSPVSIFSFKTVGSRNALPG